MAYCLIASFCAVAYWMSIELLVIVYATFKRRTGLHFWSIIITTIGIILQTTGYLLIEFAPNCPHILKIIIAKIGWVSNVTGFSIVLWSRLHLVVNNPRILKAVLAMILINCVCLHTPIIVLDFGLASKHRDKFYPPMEIMERVQQIIFTLQETIISGLYIYHTARFLSSGYTYRTRKVIGLLFGVQALVIAFDAGLTAFDYNNMFTLKYTLHPFVYALKLKLEFIVLNQLLTIVKKGLAPGLQIGLVGDSDSFSAGSHNEHASIPNPHKFITKSELVLHQTKSLSEGSTSSTSMVDSITVAPAAALAILNEEEDLMNIIGRPDEYLTKTESAISDVERQYLGRYKC